MPAFNTLGNVDASQLADATQYIFAHRCFDGNVQVQVWGMQPVRNLFRASD